MARKLQWCSLALGVVVVIIAGGVLWVRSGGVADVNPPTARVAVQRSQRLVAAAVDRPSSDEAAASQTKSRRYARLRVEQYLPRDVTDRGPLPPAGTPWPVLYAKLKARDDAPAIERLYHDTVRCRIYFDSIAWAKIVLKMSDSPATASTVQNDYAAKSLRHARETMDRYETMCADTDAKAVHTAVLRVTFQAAQRGDASAAACYVQEATVISRTQHPTPAVIALRRQHIEAVAQAYFERGDWIMVFMMEGAYTPSIDAISVVTPPNPPKLYAYTRLHQLGATDESAAQMNTLLANLRRIGHLTSAQASAADAWAQTMYQQYFIGHPQPPSDHWRTCSTK